MALIVGCVLSVINQGMEIVEGYASWNTLIRVALNFLVPFLVSSYGLLSAARVPPGNTRR